MKVYRAKSKVTGKYFKSSADQYIFMTKGALKNAWFKGNSRSNRDTPYTFDNQDEFVIIEYELVPTNTGEVTV